MGATHALFDVDPFAITICKKGANRQRIFLRKSGEDETTTVLPGRDGILKAAGADWSVFYCVVAEPGAEEDGGMGAPGVVDVWKNEDEIRKAAHRFAKNKGYVNAMHGTLAEQGCHVVENAVALHDFQVGEATIRKGSWYIAVEPDERFKAAVDAGEITGVSMEGSGLRETLVKASFAGAAKCKGCGGKVATDASKCQNCGSTSLAKAGTMVHEPTVPPGGPGLFGMKGKQLPAYIQHVFNDLVQKGKPKTSETYRLAVGIVQNWAAGHDGKGGKVSPDTQAKAAAAIAEWNKLRAEARAKVNKENMMDNTEKVGLLRSVATALGIAKSDEGLSEEEKALLASPAEGGSVTDDKPKGTTTEEDVDTARIEKIEKAVADQNESMTKLIGLVEKLATRKPDDEAPTAESLKKSLEDFSTGIATSIEKISADLDALASGGSSQDQGGEREPVKKSDNPLAGILS